MKSNGTDTNKCILRTKTASPFDIIAKIVILCRYLHDRGIIEHWLGNDKEVADLFSRLCQEVVFDFNNSYLSGLSDRVNKYYNSRWNTWSATLKHSYFSNPWAIISLVAAVFLLILTFAQTFYSVYSYYRPP